MKQTHIGIEDLARLREALEEERIELEEELSLRGEKSESGDWQGKPAGFEEPEADEVDTADRLEELVTNVPLVESLETRHKDVIRAITKIDDGSYGICEVEGDEIPLDRLNANPAARTCLTHAK